MRNENYTIHARSFQICGKTLRVFYDRDEIRFCGRDAAEILGFKSGTDAVNRYCPNKVKHPMDVEESCQIVYTTAINVEDLASLFDHAHADADVRQSFEIAIFDVVFPAYTESRRYALWYKFTGARERPLTEAAKDLGYRPLD